MLILRSSYFALRRMLRNYIGMGILLVTPIALITVLGMIAGDEVNQQLGITYKASVAIIMIFTFQIYGGFVTMEYARDDLLGVRKWRIFSLPYYVHQHAVSILLASTLFNVSQGLAIVVYSKIVYGVQWGNLGLVILTLLSVAMLSQLIFLNILLSVKTYKTAENLGTIFGLASIVLAEVWFPLPDNTFFNFLSTYGNPLSLGKNMTIAIMTGENINQAMISFGVLLVAAMVMVITAILLGRRKLT